MGQWVTSVLFLPSRIILKRGDRLHYEGEGITEILPPTFECCDACVLCRVQLLWNPNGIHVVTRRNSGVIWLLRVHLIKYRMGRLSVVWAGETAFRSSSTWIGTRCHHAKVDKMMELKTVL